MENLSPENKSCADCESDDVTNANMDKGITLCAECALTHQKILKIPTRNLAELNEEEISYINKHGNNKSNSALVKNVMPWTVTLKNNNNHLARDWYIEAKYEKFLFSKEITKKKPQYEFTGMWYYIDEVSRETPWIKGPYSRQAIRKLLDDKKLLFKDSFVWHPVLGSKWMKVERVYDIINPKPNLTDSILQEACLKKLHLQSLPHPHLRGTLEVQSSNCNGKRWVVILDKQIVINSVQGSAQSLEKRINIEDLNEISLQISKNNKLCINIEDSDGTLQLTAGKTDEIIEWFQAIACCRHLIHALGPDYPVLEIDLSEQNVCNVKSSIEYAGDKVFEGVLKKQGSKWKNIRSRWFVLRTGTLSYYKNKQDSKPKKTLRITGNAVIDSRSEYKQQFHFSLMISERILHMWADSQSDKEAWCEKLALAVEKVKVIEEERVGSN